MAWSAPTPADLKARFPEFTAVPDARVQVFLAECEASECWIEADRTLATLYKAAHFMSAAGEPDLSKDIAAGGDGSGAASATGSKVKSHKVDGTETVFMTKNEEFGSVSSGAGGQGDADDYGSTLYGVRFLELRARNFPAVAIA